MARSLRCLISSILSLLLLQSLLPSLAQGQGNSTFIDQSTFTNFELFKNTGLQLCSINSTFPKRSLSELEARSPRGGGRGGGGRGGGSGSGSGGGYTGGSFIESTFVSDQQTFCSKMRGTTVMIPNTPTLYGFIPQWPTYIAQFASTFLSLGGLWWMTKAVSKPGQYKTKIPILFWIQLPLDTARIVAWLFTAVYGFAKPQHFAWVNVILWVIPFNYIWFVRLMHSDRSRPPVVANNLPSYYNQYGHRIDQSKEPIVVEQNAQPLSTDSHREGPKKLQFLSWIFMAITGLLWLISLIVMVLHFKFNWSAQKTHPTYIEAAGAMNNPSSIGKSIPQACVTWLRSNNSTVSKDLLNVGWLQILQAAIVALQFITSSLIIGQTLRKQDIPFSKLKISIVATSIALLVPAIATDFWILGSVKLGKQDDWLIYTNNFNTTGGCTFASLNMNRQWGYWDVDSQRGFRVAMSLLGVA